MAETELTHGACCPVVNTLDIIGGKWKVLILYYLHGEIRRFNELQRLLAGVTQRMLTLQLRELENDVGLFMVVYPQVPPKQLWSIR